jgi:hypothetical protein
MRWSQPLLFLEMFGKKGGYFVGAKRSSGKATRKELKPSKADPLDKLNAIP